MSILVFVSCESKNEINPAFFEISKGKAKVYLLPSIHFSNKSIYPLPDYIMDAYSNSPEVGFEFDLSIPLVNQNHSIPEKPDIKLVVSDETYDLLEKYAKQTNIGLRFCVNKDAIECSEFIMKTELQWNNISSLNGIETFFYNLAKNDKKEMIGLEEYKDYAIINDTMSNKEKENQLKNILQNRKGLVSLTTKAIQLWKSGDLKEIYNINKKSFMDSPELYDKKIDKRNIKMALAVEQLLKQEKVVFVIVGAGHFYGENSILKILESKGYKTKIINKA